jgi:hypothetical protein
MSGFSTGLTKINDAFFPMIERQLTGNGIAMDTYSKNCVMNAISSINNALESKGITWNDPQLDKNNLTQILMSVASLKLNAAASPREVYFQTRNVSVKSKDETGKDITVWKKQIEMGIEGDGNDAILARFGRDVEAVKQFWLVRENDNFEYPTYNGLEMQPPKWSPTGKGDVVRVVYPVIKTDKTVEFFIAERDDVIKNLIAHINNNMMNETFGICENRFKATIQQKEQIASKKNDIMKRVKGMGLKALDEPEFQKWISPAWSDPQSRESMIIRKMRNNIVKKIPKDFGNAFVAMVHEESTDDSYARVRKEINDNANSEVIDIDPKPHKQEGSTEPPHNDGPINQQEEHQNQETESSSHNENSEPVGGPTW